MISVDEALAEILSHMVPLEAERVAILDALGRVLVQEIVSDIDIPPFDNSAMDGYAVRAADVAGASPECAGGPRGRRQRGRGLCRRGRSGAGDDDPHHDWRADAGRGRRRGPL